MADVEIRKAKILQPLRCKCGHAFTGNDMKAAGDEIELVCSACHSTAFKIECEARSSASWG